MQDKIQSFITNKCYQASAKLAKEKGSFPMFDKDKYLAGNFIATLLPETIDLIRKYGIRNSHLISIAPTGTISFCADNISSGVEPVLAYTQKRKIIMSGGDKIVIVPDYGVAHLGTKGKTVVSGEITANEHIDVLCIAQKHCDSAVSKTINVPTDFPYDKFKDIYMTAWENGAKGCTTYRPTGAYDEPIQEADPEVCGFDPETGARIGECADA